MCQSVTRLGEAKHKQDQTWEKTEAVGRENKFKDQQRIPRLDPNNVLMSVLSVNL